MITTTEAMYLWAPEAVHTLGGFVVAVLVPMLCLGWGVKHLRQAAS